jgi:hypothetical protein
VVDEVWGYELIKHRCTSPVLGCCIDLLEIALN